MSTVSGITLSAVPARIFVIVTTTGSNVLMRRVAITCNACTISAAIGIGSFARYGVDACPPLPVTLISSTSADAMSGPPRVQIVPDGRFGETCSANAASTGASPSSTPSSIMYRAP